MAGGYEPKSDGAGARRSGRLRPPPPAWCRRAPTKEVEPVVIDPSTSNPTLPDLAGRGTAR
jgi:hypothetical protein